MGTEQQIDYGGLFQAMPTAYLVMSPDFTILSANAAYLKLTRRSSAELVGRYLFEAFPDNPHDPHANGVANLRASLMRVLATGRPDRMPLQRYDVAAEAGDSHYQIRYWKPSNTPVCDAAGAVTCIIHSVEEVTAAYLTQGKNSRDVLADLADAIRELKTPEEIVLEAAAILGPALGVRRVGYGTVDHGEDNSLTVLHDWCAPGADTLAGTMHLPSFGSFKDELERHRFIALSNVGEDPHTAPFADALRARGIAALVSVPVIEDGRVSTVLFVNDAAPRTWTVEDIVLIKEVAARIRMAIERVRNLSALRESEAKFRTIADAMPQMVWSTLPDGYHDYYNEQWYKFTGVPDHSTDGDGWNGIFHPDDQDRAWAAWRASLATGNTYEIQYRLRHHSGAYRWVLGRALPIHDDHGAIIRWMGTCTDIDDQKRAEEELRRTSERKDEFLAMLAHELRNPLAPITSAAQLLIMGSADPQRVRKSGDIILRQVRHLTDLVDDLLDVSRVTRGLVHIERSPLDLKAVLQHAVEQARPLIEARHHRLVIELAPAHPTVSGDRTRLVQVIANLLNNAAKYTPQGGRIALSLAMHEHEAHVTVTDSGIGIAPALLPYVFDLFVQAERTPDRAQGGLGLGLALVKRITTLHDGSVHVRSDGLGKGSSFTVVLPTVAARDGAGDDADGAPGQPGRAAKVMIVDDHLDGAQSLAALLSAQGHEVAVAEDGASGLALAAGRETDVFILDIGLPDIDGYELARRLRAAGGQDALLIALTGYGQAHDRLLSKVAGFDHHFVKPVDIAALNDAIVLWQQRRHPMTQP
jgi:PAS domain S-box-containing protein